ncbi:MAG: VOC family protein [Hyphomonadaceae bacterium]
MPKVVGVGLAVSDLERSAAFYTQHFALERYETLDLPNMREIVLGWPDNSFRLLLMQYHEKRPRDPRLLENKLVFGVRDAAAIAEELRAAGAEITREPAPADGFACVAFALDPDGHTLELLQR